MDKERMKQMLKEGYTPEYVSLIKWQELRRKVLDGENYSPWDLWLTHKHNLPIKGINKNLQEWEKNEFNKVHRTPRER